MKEKVKKIKSKRARGGIATFRKYGSEHMSMLAKRMHKLKKKNGGGKRK